MANVTGFNDTDLSLFDNNSNSTDDVVDTLRRQNTRTRALQPWSFEIQICAAIICAMATLFGILANAIVLYSYVTISKLRTYANYFVFGLALVDFIDVVLVLPLLSVYNILGFWPFSKAACELYKFSNHVMLHMSNLFTLVICIERYKALTQPFKNLQRRTKRRAISMMTTACLIPILSWIGPLIIWPIFGKNIPRQYITTLCYPHYSRIKIFALFSSCYTSLLPLSLICVLYTLVVRAFRRRLSAIEKRSARETHVATVHHVEPRSSAAADELSTFQNKEFTRNAVLKDSIGRVNMGYDSDDPEGITVKPQDIKSLRREDTTKAADHRKRTGSVSQQKISQQDKIEEQNLKATKVLSMIVIVMLIARVPWSVTSCYQILCGHTCLPLNLAQVWYNVGLLVGLV